MKKILFAVFLSVSTLSSFATAVRSLPEPDADGYYVFGAPYTYSKTTAYEWKSNCNQPAFPVWSEIGLPDNAKVKFVGGVILDSFPANVAEIDCSELTFMAIIKSDIKNLTGQKLLIPEGAKLCVSNTDNGYPKWDGDTMTEWKEKHLSFKLHADIEVNGTLCWCKNNLEIHGALTGSGEFNMSHDTAVAKFYGSVSFTGNMKAPAAASNAASSVLLFPPDAKASVGSVVYVVDGSKSGYFLYAPKTMPGDLELVDLGASIVGNPRNFTVGFSGDSAVRIGTLSGPGMRFATVDTETTEQSDVIGGASLTVDNVLPQKYKSTAKSGTYYLSKNMSYEFKQLGYASPATDSTVNMCYDLETGNNTNALTISGTIAYASGNGSQRCAVNISGTSPASLPRTMNLWRYDGQTTSGVKYTIGADVTLSSSEWAFDFDWTKDDPNLSRCEITGAKTATIPESGTIAITTNGKPGAKTVYPLFTCDVGCAALADATAWPVTINGTLVEGDEFSNGTAKYKIIRTETGIYLQANIVKGLMLILR